MKIIKNISVIIIVIVLNSMGLNAQCMMNHNHKNTTDDKTHQNNNVKNEKMEVLKKDTHSFTVIGKCGMCKNRIEKAALAVKGVNTAEWNEETQMLTVNLNPETKLDDVDKAMANAGHDTEKYKADDKVYNALPMCCKYR